MWLQINGMFIAEVISFVVQSISNDVDCSLSYNADLGVHVVSFISCSMGYDQHNHHNWNYLVKGHRLYSGTGN